MLKKACATLIAVSLAFGLLAGCSFGNSKQEPDFSGVRSVCELSSLQCYFHNVAKVTDTTKVLKKKRQMWMEYDGIVKYGIDVAKVTVSEPDARGVVKVSVPDAQVLSVYLDKESIQEPITDKDVLPWNKFSMEDRTKSIAKAQESMRVQAEANEALLAQATDRAKDVLEGYVINVGQTIGQTYTVEWVEG